MILDVVKPIKFGFTAIGKLKNCASLDKTFSNVDFTNCQCVQILNSMYSQMLDHCIGSGNMCFFNLM